MTSKKRVCIYVLAMGIFLAPLSFSAGGEPMIGERPVKGHRFLDATNLSLLSVNALIMVADAATSRRALQVPGAHEANPLLQSTAAQISFKVAGVGAGLGLAYLMHKTGHHNAERLIPLFVGVPSAIAAAHNTGIHQ